MGVDADRQRTAPERRARIIKTLNETLGNPTSHPIAELRRRLAENQVMVVGADIDGIVSAMMVASVSNWRIAALVVGSESVLTAPGHGINALRTRDDVVGIDLFSPLFPSISNHPLLFGLTPGLPVWLRTALDEFDRFITDRCVKLGSINLSIWVGIKARLDSQSPDGMPYKYPLGTAQLLLAVLEAAGKGPRFYDRQYLPWLVANCDGGIETIRAYPWNVEGWWSALAAVVGPASQSEALYRLATTQRPTEFIDVDRRLRYDYAELSKALNVKWNLVSRKADDLTKAVRLITQLSGWPDPFLFGVSNLEHWTETSPTGNALSVRGMTKQDRSLVELHLKCAREAIHVNFSTFKERGTALGWMLADDRPDVDRLLGKAPPEETSVGTEPENTAPSAEPPPGEREAGLFSVHPAADSD